MEFVPVARSEEVPAGEARLFAYDEFRALLVRVDNTVFALQAKCPHKDCEWDGAKVDGEILSCPQCHVRYSVRTGLNPLTTACHVNQSTAEYHYRSFPEGKAAVYDVRIDGDAVMVATSPRPFRKVVV